MVYSFNNILEKLNNKQIKSSIITLSLRVIGVITLFVFTIFLNRNFSPDIVGDYEFTRMFLLVTGGICIIGTDVSILYFSGLLKSENKFYKIKSLYYKVLILSAILCLLILLIFYSFFSELTINTFFGKSNSYYLVSTSLLFLIFNVWTLFNTEVLRALDQIVWSELFRNTFKFFPIFIGSYLLYNSNSPELILDVYIKGFAILCLITTLFVVFLLKRIPDSKHINDGISFKEIIRYSFPMCISSIIIYLLSTIDIVLLRNFYGSSDVAYYALAIKLISISGMIILSINVNVSPHISELYANKEIKILENLLRKSSRIIFSLNLLLCIVLLIFSDYVLSFFGKEYVIAKEAFVILILGQLIVSGFGSVAVFLNMTGRPSVFRRILFIALILNMVLNYLLIPKLGLKGAAITYVITILFWNSTAAIYILRKDNIKTFIH